MMDNWGLRDLPTPNPPFSSFQATWIASIPATRAEVPEGRLLSSYPIPCCLQDLLPTFPSFCFSADCGFGPEGEVIGLPSARFPQDALLWPSESRCGQEWSVSFPHPKKSPAVKKTGTPS